MTLFLYLKACGREELNTTHLWVGADMQRLFRSRERRGGIDNDLFGRRPCGLAEALLVAWTSGRTTS